MIADDAAKGVIKILRKQKPPKSVARGVKRGAKHWSGTDLTWAPEKEVKREAVDRIAKADPKTGRGGSDVRRIDALHREAAAKGKPVDARTAARQHRKAMRNDAMKPIRALIKKRGFNWMKFKEQRLDKDPNLSKLGPGLRKERLVEIYNELGEDGFIERFNL
jgi:hypothetical protein